MKNPKPTWYLGNYEIWDVYDRDGNITGKVKSRDDVFLDGEFHLASSLWIINNEGKALIQKRAMTKRINPGMWNITGGSANAGERSKDACIREVLEEIGLVVQLADMTLISRSFGKECIFDDYIVFCDFPLSDLTLQVNEVIDVKWVTFDEIDQLFYKGQFMFDDIDELKKVRVFVEKEKASIKIKAAKK
jgi:isopentenyldiphosphate isomerase